MLKCNRLVEVFDLSKKLTFSLIQYNFWNWTSRTKEIGDLDRKLRRKISLMVLLLMILSKSSICLYILLFRTSVPLSKTIRPMVFLYQIFHNKWMWWQNTNWLISAFCAIDCQLAKCCNKFEITMENFDFLVYLRPKMSVSR